MVIASRLLDELRKHRRKVPSALDLQLRANETDLTDSILKHKGGIGSYEGVISVYDLHEQEKGINFLLLSMTTLGGMMGGILAADACQKGNLWAGVLSQFLVGFLASCITVYIFCRCRV